MKSRLGALDMERQTVITWARKRQITDKDMDMQLAVLAAEATELKTKLAETSLLIGNRA